MIAKKLKTGLFQIALNLVMPYLALHCSSSGEGDPGQCTLSCGTAKIGSSDFKVTAMTETIETICAPGGGFTSNGVYEPFDVPITIKFLVTRAASEFHSRFGNANATDKNTMGTITEAPEDIPIGGLRFNPIVTGMLDGKHTDPENGTPPTSGIAADPPTYSGIVTPKSEWCTDSCGVAAVTVWPLCVAQKINTITVFINSGGTATMDKPATIKVMNN